MPSLPDVPGKGLATEVTKRARSLATGAAGTAVALGGEVAKQVITRAGGGRGDDSDAGTDAGPRDRAAPVAVAPAPPSPPAAPKVAPTPKPRVVKPKPPNVAPRPKPQVVKPKVAEPKAAPAKPEPKVGAKPKQPEAGPAKPKPPKAKAAKPKAKSAAKPKPKAPGKAKAKRPTPKPAAGGSGKSSAGKDPHHALNHPVADPDPTEYPDPYDKREDPRDPVDPDGMPFGEEPHSPTGAGSTSEPPLSQDPEVEDGGKPPQRDKLDD